MQSPYELPRAGTYYVRLHVRHEDPNCLFRLMTSEKGEKIIGSIPRWTGTEEIPLLPMLLKMKLCSKIQLQTFLTIREAVANQDENDPWPVSLAKNSFMACYIRTLIESE